MLCACSGEKYKFEEVTQSPESLATRDFSASGLSSRTGDWESRFEDSQVEDVESTLKEALSLNYEEARALLGRLEYQKGNIDGALQVFHGINIRSLMPRMTKAIVERTRQRKWRSKGHNPQNDVMSMHSTAYVALILTLTLSDAAKECRVIIDTVEAALPNGLLDSFAEDCKLQEILHKSLELLPSLWKQAGFLDEAIAAYRLALSKPWNLHSQKLATIQKDLAGILIHGGVEVSFPPQLRIWGPTTPKDNMEEAILLLFILMRKITFEEIRWDPEIMDHLTFALSVSGQFEFLAEHVEQVLPGIYNRAERWYFLALCYSATGQDEVALNLLQKALGLSESRREPHLPSLLLGAKLCSKDPEHAAEGINFSRRAIDITTHRYKHLKGQAYKFLGVCCGNASRVSGSDTQRVLFQSESLKSLTNASMMERDDPEIIFNLGLENAVQRNLNAALRYVRTYLKLMGGSSLNGWKLLSLVLSAEERFEDAETIVDLALDEAGIRDELELLRLKAVLQIAQEQPKNAIETFRVLLSLIQTHKEIGPKNPEVQSKSDLEMKAWRDLSNVYTRLGSWSDAGICVEKAKSIRHCSADSWHQTGLLFVAQTLYKKALVAFSISLSIEPDHAPSMVSTAAILRKFGKNSLPIAKSFLMNAVRLQPTNDEAWLNLGLISKMEGSIEQAAEFFQAAYELKQSAPVLNYL
ncbi:hypothetical protein IFM89_016671 [Coptis chinensis]|uniref:Uncharacterized protein n=1 Tax=Coptis chinensis TaxID=261450 RepID=A0A835IR60_9MAGN|nr:hypothetical protein IFM89_016671 [Coptis chinensis]